MKNNKTKPQQACFIMHPAHINPSGIRTRIICQLIAHIKGEINLYGHKHYPGAVVFCGTREEEALIQSLADRHLPVFWQRVEQLYHEYIHEHGLYTNEETNNTTTSHLNEQHHKLLAPLSLTPLVSTLNTIKDEVKT